MTELTATQRSEIVQVAKGHFDRGVNRPLDMKTAMINSFPEVAPEQLVKVLHAEYRIVSGIFSETYIRQVADGEQRLFSLARGLGESEHDVRLGLVLLKAEAPKYPQPLPVLLYRMHEAANHYYAAGLVRQNAGLPRGYRHLWLHAAAKTLEGAGWTARFARDGLFLPATLPTLPLPPRTARVRRVERAWLLLRIKADLYAALAWRWLRARLGRP